MPWPIKYILKNVEYFRIKQYALFLKSVGYVYGVFYFWALKRHAHFCVVCQSSIDRYLHSQFHKSSKIISHWQIISFLFWNCHASFYYKQPRNVGIVLKLTAWNNILKAKDHCWKPAPGLAEHTMKEQDRSASHCFINKSMVMRSFEHLTTYSFWSRGFPRICASPATLEYFTFFKKKMPMVKQASKGLIPFKVLHCIRRKLILGNK